MDTQHGHDLDAFRTWLLDRPRAEIPDELVPAWMEVRGYLMSSTQRCERLVNHWRRWVHEQVAQAETEEQDA